jgi:ribosome recycling factor
MNTEQQTKDQMQAALDHFKEELKNIRTGRANPGILDSVRVEAYGSQMRLKELATITTPELRQLLVTPFDQSNINAVSKAIEKANLGMMPQIDGNVIRLNIPPMDEALRKEMVKLVNKRKEECKISVRNLRRDCNDTIRKMKQDGDIAEDMLHSMEKKIQTLTDDFCKLADELAAIREKEVMTV